MINQKSVLAIITARGGSKGVPRKNVLPVGGKPLIAWTIDEAKKSTYLDRIILSSDDDEIIDVAKNHGCEVPFVRPAEMASDTASSVDVVMHAIDGLDEEYDIIVLLQPTSPLRLVEDIDGCIVSCEQSGGGCVTVTESDKSPYWSYKVGENNVLDPLYANEHTKGRRQELEKTFVLNGAVYAVDRVRFIEEKTFVGDDTLALIMPRERSVDIDTPLDMEFVRFMMSQNKI